MHKLIDVGDWLMYRLSSYGPYSTSSSTNHVHEYEARSLAIALNLAETVPIASERGNLGRVTRTQGASNIRVPSTSTV